MLPVALMADYKKRIRDNHPRLYSQDLLNNLFRHPYTRIEFLADEVGVVRQTAARYLDELTAAGFLEKQTRGKHNFYINKPLVALFVTAPARAYDDSRTLTITMIATPNIAPPMRDNVAPATNRAAPGTAKSGR